MDNTFGAGTEPPVDLSALRDAPRWEALAARIERAAAPELARRAAARGGATPDASDDGVIDLVPLLARALRPAMLAAAAAALAVGVGLSRGRPASTPATADVDDVTAGQLVSEAQVAQALRVGDANATWLAEGTAPSEEALAQAIGFDPAGTMGAPAAPGGAAGERP